MITEQDYEIVFSNREQARQEPLSKYRETMLTLTSRDNINQNETALLGRVIMSLQATTRLNRNDLYQIISKLSATQIIRQFSNICKLKSHNLATNRLKLYISGLSGNQLIYELNNGYLPKYSIIPICPNDRLILKRIHKQREARLIREIQQLKDTAKTFYKKAYDTDNDSLIMLANGLMNKAELLSGLATKSYVPKHITEHRNDLAKQVMELGII